MPSSHQLMVIPLEAQRASKNIEVNVLVVVENFSQEGNFGFLFVVYCLCFILVQYSLY